MLSHDTAPEDTVRLENCQVPSKTRVFLFFITVIIFNGYIYIIIMIIIIIIILCLFLSLLHTYIYIYPL